MILDLRLALLHTAIVSLSAVAVRGENSNARILASISAMPRGGTYGAYQSDAPADRRFDALRGTVEDLNQSIRVGFGSILRVNPQAAAPLSFCSSATYLLFCRVIEECESDKVLATNGGLAAALDDIGDPVAVINGDLDGIGIFGHWNADGPGTAVLFHKLGLGRNFLGYEQAQPGDFLKIFWNDKIGKGERGHLVVYLGTSPDGASIQVWSSNTRNEDGSSGYGTMWVEKSRIVRALFSRLEHPERLTAWLALPEEERRSDYLIGIRKTASTEAEMVAATGAIR
jgi:hypothetical protein